LSDNLFVAISVALLVAFAVACHSQSLGSGLVNVYFNWSPWHYAGQNFGIALTLLPPTRSNDRV
ncbi:MAG: hypothetical protein QMC73_06585, partial [Myxococcota bacterium]